MTLHKISLIHYRTVRLSSADLLSIEELGEKFKKYIEAAPRSLVVLDWRCPAYYRVADIDVAIPARFTSS